MKLLLVTRDSSHESTFSFFKKNLGFGKKTTFLYRQPGVSFRGWALNISYSYVSIIFLLRLPRVNAGESKTIIKNKKLKVKC